MDIKKILATAGRVAAGAVLNTILPGSGGLVQTVENLLGPRTGSEKKALASTLALQILETLAKSGRLTSGAPALAEVETAVQTTVTEMKANGTLEETGVMTVAGLSYQVIVVGRLPES